MLYIAHKFNLKEVLAEELPNNFKEIGQKLLNLFKSNKTNKQSNETSEQSSENTTIIDDPRLPFKIEIDENQKPKVKVPSFIIGPAELVGSFIISKFFKTNKNDQDDQKEEEYYWYGTGEDRVRKKKDPRLVKSLLDEVKKLESEEEK